MSTSRPSTSSRKPASLRKSQNRRQQRGLFLEALENRQMMAVDFTALPYTTPVNQPAFDTNMAAGTTEPMVTINDNDPGNIIITNQNLLRATTNAGGTYTATLNFGSFLPGGSATNGDTDTMFDSQGRLFWTNLVDPGPGRNVGIAQINPTTGAVIPGTLNNPPNPGSNGDDKQMLAADRDPFGVSPFADNLYVSWQRFLPGSEWTVFGSVSTDQGATWTNTAPLSDFDGPNNIAGDFDDEGFAWPSDIAVAPNGDVFLAYHSQPDINDNELEGGAPTNPNGTSGQIFILRSTDGGLTYGQKVRAFDQGEADITYNRQDAPAGNIAGLASWTVGAGQPWVLPDATRNGQIYVVASDDPDNVHGAGDDFDVVISRSTNNGLTWTNSTVPDGAPGAMQLFPTAAIDDFGNIVVAWLDNRRGLANGAGTFLLDVYATYSTDGGLTWAPAFMVSDPSDPLDPDVGVAQRFAGPPATTRIGEYFGIDVFGGTAYVIYNRNNSAGAGATEAFLDSFAIAGSITVTGDDTGVVTNDAIVIRQIANNPGSVEVLVNGTRQYAGLLDGLAGGITVAGLAGNDTLTVDYSNGNPTPAGGIHFNGGGQAGDNLVIVGNGNSHGVYRPDSAVTGAGTVTVDGDVISFENLQPITVNGFFEFTVETPNSVDALTVDSPAAGQNRVNGTSGNIAIENVTFFDIVHFEIDTATNDGPLPTTGSDTLDFSNLVATGLLSMTVLTGNGNDTVNAGAVLTVPLTIDGGDGDDLLTGGDGSDRIYGGAGNDRLTGSGGFDILDGGTGTDSLNWAQGDGDDDLVGGDGIDEFVFVGADAATLATEDIFLRSLGQGPEIGARAELFRTQGDIEIGLDGVEIVTVIGFGGADNFTVNNLSVTDVKTVNLQLFLNFGADDVFVGGTATNDVLTVHDVPVVGAPAGSLVRVSGLPYDVNIVSADVTDVDQLTINGNEGDDNVAVAPGIETFIAITLNGNAGNDTLTGNVLSLNGDDGDDTLIGGAGNQTFDGGAGDDTFVGGGGTDNVGGGGLGSVGDTILVAGTSGADTISLALDPAGLLLATVNGVTTTYGNFLGGPIAASGIEQILVQGLAGNDSLTVDSTNGAIPILINFDGGNNADVLTLTGGTATSNTYSVGPDITEGTSTIVIGGVTQTVRFNALEPVNDLVAGPLVANGTNENNAINLSGNVLSIDGFESITFDNKTDVTINSLAGDDTIHIADAAGLTGTLTIAGDDPTASDTVVVSGTAGADNVTIDQLTLDGASVQGLGPIIVVTTTEHLVYSGLGGDDNVTVTATAGNDRIQLTPGLAADAGNILVNQLIPIDFQGVGANGTLSIADLGGASDVLTYNGSLGNDNFAVNVGIDGAINLQTDVASVLGGVSHISVLVPTAGQFIEGLTLDGMDGDDNVVLSSSTLFTLGIAINGGNPSAGSDRVSINGTAGADTLALTLGAANDSVSGVVGGAVVLTGVEDLSFSTGSGDDALTVNGLGGQSALANVAFFSGGDANDTTLINGTTNADQFTVTPLSAVSARVSANNVGPVITSTMSAAATSTFTVDGGSANDQVTVEGTSANDTIAVVRAATTTVLVNALKTISIPTGTTESIRIAAGDGNDTTNITGTGGTAFLVVDSGLNTTNDTVTIINTTAGVTTVTPGATSDAGTIGTPDGGVEFLGTELVTLTGATAADTLTANGTNGNDSIALQSLGGANRFWVNSQAVVSFSSFGTVTLNGRFGDDKFSVSPIGLVGVTTINVNGGDPTASDELIVNGTTGNNAINYTTSATIGAGTVAITGAATVNFTTTESLVIDGQGGTDLLTLTNTTGHRVTYTPGSAADSGTMTSVGLGLGTAAVPLTFSHIGANALVTIAGAGDLVEVNGTNNSDTFFFSGASVQILNAISGFVTPLIQTTNVVHLDLRGLDGDDTFLGTGSLAAYAFGVNIDGGNPSASDEVILSGAVGAVGVTLGATTTVDGYGSMVNLLGVEILNADVTLQDATLTGTAGDDVIDITPTGTDAVTAFLASSNPAVSGTPKVNFSNIGATMTVDGGAGTNSLVFNGTQAAETIVATNTSLTVGALQTVDYTNASALQVNGLGGDDILSVVNTTGLIATPLNFSGGIGSDTLSLTGTTAVTSAAYNVGPNADQGRVTHVLGAVTQTVTFDGLEPVQDNVTAALLTINGTNANNAINLSGNVLSIDGFESITFDNKTDVTINSLAGDDTIHVADAAGLTGTLTVAGDDPTASDTVVISGTAAVDNVTIDQLTLDGARVQGLGPIIIVATTERLVYSGLGGVDTLNLVTPAGRQSINFLPGANVASGTVLVHDFGGGTGYLPFNYVGLASNSTLTLSDVGGARADLLTYHGTDQDDNFTVSAAGNIELEQPNFLFQGNLAVEILTAGVSQLALLGLEGDDIFNIPGNHPFTDGILVEGGNPSASDTIFFNGTGTPVVIDLAAKTIRETAAGQLVAFTGIEDLVVNAGGGTITVNGTTGPDDLTVTPTTANDTTIEIDGDPLTIFTTNTAALNIDLLAGNNNKLTVVGTQAGETIVATGALVTVGALKTVNYTNVSALVADGQAGSDTFNVTPSATTAIFIDGGDPIGPVGDTLAITVPAGAGTTTFAVGPENDAGGFSFSAGGIQPISFDHIEAIGPIDLAAAGGVLLVCGTNGDDDITVVGTGASSLTVSINDGPVIAYVGVTTLTVQGKAGDDDIDVTVGPLAITAINVEGNDPTASDNLLVVGTLGVDTVAFTPTGTSSGSLTGLTTPVNFTTTEHVVYDGNDVAALDVVTINGTLTNDSFTYDANSLKGSFRSFASPDFDTLRSARIVVTGGGGGADVVNLLGSAGVDVITSAANAITVNTTGALAIVTLGAGIDAVTISTLDGNDNINLAGITATSTVIAGDGNDTVVGSPQVDSIFGGFGNDILVGGASNDFLYGEEGNDIFGNLTLTADGVADDAGNDFAFGGEGFDNFVWEPGDGADSNNGGGDAADIFRFFGSAAANTFTLQSGGTPTHFNALIGALTIDNHGIEDIVVDGRGGGDTYIVNDLYATEVVAVNLVLGTAGPDPLDAVTVHGREVADDVTITSPAAGSVRIQGLRYNVSLTNATTTDTLTFQANEGDDRVKAAVGVETTIGIILNGNAGNDTLSADAIINGGTGDDTLTGGIGADTINGNEGNDIIFGGTGIDTISGGDDDDEIHVDFDGAIDVIAGNDGYDRIVISGTPGADTISAFQSLATQLISTLQFTTAPGGNFTDTDTIGTVEQVDINAGNGNDNIFVQHAEALEDAAANAVRFMVDGGTGFTGDRLIVQDNLTGDLLLFRKADNGTEGSITVGPTNAEPLVTDFTNIEYVNPVAAAGGTVVVFKYDPYEYNNDRFNATTLGVGETLNADPVIDPGAVAPLPPGFLGPVPQDEDWYRVQALYTGTLDVRLYFRHLAAAPVNLPGNGDLDLQITDSSGNVIDSDIDVTDNARVRIAAVQGEVYFLRVFGKTAGALNTYDVSVANEAAPVPFDLELDDALNVGSDTGRSRFDNVTFDSTPTIFLRVADHSLLFDGPDNGAAPPAVPFDTEVYDIPFQVSTATNAPATGFRLAIFDTENNTHDPVFLGYATPVLGSPGVYTFQFNTPLADGSHFISARVEIIDGATAEQAQGFGDFANLSLEIIVDTVAPPSFFGFGPPIGVDGLHPDSDSGYDSQIGTLTDRYTNDLTPTLWGDAEANSIIRVFLDVDNNGVIDATDLFMGQTVAIPEDGGDQDAFGHWELTSFLSMDDPIVVNALQANGVIAAGQINGPRRFLLSSEDLAGNILDPADDMNIFIDTQGPQVSSVVVANDPAYDLFDPKPSTDGPTPLINALNINFVDQPIRQNGQPIAVGIHSGLNLQLALANGNYRLVGDHVGVVTIDAIGFQDFSADGTLGLSTVQLVFFNALPDDRYTLTISERIGDDAGNALDGDTNTVEPQEFPLVFPSGDGNPGGDFVARFTVDTRPEIGVWATGSVWVDTNGNSEFDPKNTDVTNRDIVYQAGLVTDDVFAGNFARLQTDIADGFDKLAYYGGLTGGSTQRRFKVDVTNDGVSDFSVFQVGTPNGVPVAGNFDFAHPNSILNGDEVGVWTGTQWFFDTDHSFSVAGAGDFVLTSNLRGYGFVGDFDGDGRTDLGTFKDDIFSFDLGGVGATLNANLPGLDGNIDRQFRFGQVGTRERPVVADMNMDGFDDIGLYQPDRTGVTPHEGSEWYWLISNGQTLFNRIVFNADLGANTIDFTPTPFGNDIYQFFGEEFSDPIVGNFDPPVTKAAPTVTSFGKPYDIDLNGKVDIQDIMYVVYGFNLNSDGTYARFADANHDDKVDIADLLGAMFAFNQEAANGESPDAAPAVAESTDYASAVDEVFAEDSFDEAILALTGDDLISRRRN